MLAGQMTTMKILITHNDVDDPDNVDDDVDDLCTIHELDDNIFCTNIFNANFHAYFKKSIKNEHLKC